MRSTNHIEELRGWVLQAMRDQLPVRTFAVVEEVEQT